MKRLTILGATGSVGRSTLDLVERHPDRFRVVGLTAGTDVSALAALARRFRPERVAIADPACRRALADMLAGEGVEILAGPGGLVEVAGAPADLVMAAIVGAAGLAPTMAALKAGIAVGLANKEALVCAGTLMTAAAARAGVPLLPVDSEHNAIFQVLEPAERVARVTLTASGGPFRQRPAATMDSVTVAEAVRHPTWSMGAKISVDSATLMNKGLELIEAHHLFRLAPDRLSVLVHPQSVVHGLVEYVDGSLLAQLGPADMRVPIAHVLAWPGRIATPVARLDLAAVARLDFEEPDRARFPALALAEAALAEGGCRPCVLNAANEVAVAAFLEGRLSFPGIAAVVHDTLARLPARPVDSLAAVAAIDAEARAHARSFAAHRQAG